MKPALIIHGGAGAWEEKDSEAAMAGVRRAAEIGWKILSEGGCALDAVEKATNFLEDHPLFDAGIGSHLTLQGEVEMDALIVDGTKYHFGAVASVKHVQYPISLARYVMKETPHCFIVGPGADALAASIGMPVIPNINFVTDGELERFRKSEHGTLGTVGAVALDADGNIASATSTGGTRNKMPGRVGDTPIFGAGGYADSRYGGASATGVGENVMRVVLSKYAIDQIMLAGSTAQEAATAAANYINGYFEESNVGLVMLDRDGNIGASHTTPGMPIAWINSDGTIHASMGGGIHGLKLEG